MDKLPNSTEENIKVIVRIKPNNVGKHKPFLTNCEQSNSIVVPEKAEFVFDKVANSNTSQEEMFEMCKNLFQSFVEGYNATIFAYGQTGSGKTFTMTGDSDPVGSTKYPGLIPRGLNFIFDKVNEMSLINNAEYLIKCSFVEIYNEQIYDLLDPQLQRLNLRFNISQEVYLEQCTEIIMDNPKMADEILKRGLSNRHMASTEMNRESSRSHAVFSIVLESSETLEGVSKIKKSCLHLVDLAGSERQRDSRTDGIRLKEAGMINKSLLALSLVIRKLVESSKSNKPAYITYRDSKLTLLLKDAIGGNSKTSLVACVHNDIRYMAETWSTLQFASSVKMIRNKAKINVDIHGDNESLRREIIRLKEQLENCKTPAIIQENELDSDRVWKRRFVTAMLLRSSLSHDVSALNGQITINNNMTLRLEKTIDKLQIQLEIKDKMLKSLEEKVAGNTTDDEDLKRLITTTLQTLKDQVTEITDQIKSDQLQIQVNYFANELQKSKNLNSLTVSDRTLIHSLIKDYNAIVKSGHINESSDNANNNVEIAHLQQELSRSKNKYSLLKKKVNSINIARRDERRKLEVEIAAMKYNLRVVDEQREAAVDDRRRTLLTVHDMRRTKLSPIRNPSTIFGQRKTKAPVDIVGDDEFYPMVDFIRKNDEDLTNLDKICVLENELRAHHSQIGKMDYNIKEYQKEIEELRNELISKQKIENNFNELEEKYNTVSMTLQESKETVQKFQNELENLEASKDKTVKILSEKVFNLTEDVKTIESDKEWYLEEWERLKLSMTCMIEELKEMEEIKKENTHKDEIIKSLNFKLSDNISFFEDIAKTKDELAKVQQELIIVSKSAEEQYLLSSGLQTKIEEYRDKDHRLTSTLSTLQEELESLRLDNENLFEINEQNENDIMVLQQETDSATVNHANKVVELETKWKTKDNDYTHTIEENQSRILQLLDELELTKSQIAEYEKEKKSLRLNDIIEEVPGFMSSPRTTSSPIIKNFNSKTSLLEDLMTSKSKTDQQLKDEHERLEKLSNILDIVICDLQLPHGDSLEANMRIVQARVTEYQNDLKDLVITKLQLEERLKSRTDQCDSLLEALKATQDQRDEFKSLLNDLMDDISAVGQPDMTQKIRYFYKLKDYVAKLQAENQQLAAEKNRVSVWLKKNNYLRLFESYEQDNKENYSMISSA